MRKTGHVYILTNKHKNVLYVGVTNDLKRRLSEHVNDPKGFVKRYNVQYLVYFEKIHGIVKAIKREKEIKGWKRAKKDALIVTLNPEWHFLNDDVLGGTGES